MRSSRTLLAYYSRHFANRPACQYELMAAFLAGQREGDPPRRIMVVNPHEEADHLVPVELAEDKFDRLPAPYDAVSMTRVVARIKAKVAGVDGYIGGVRFGEAPRWHGRIPGAYEFIGRYRELWALHSALHRHEFGLTQNVSSGAVAVLSGLPGIGKSELAAAYGWHFGAAYLGGVAQRLDGNPMALKLAGQQLRDREGLVTYAELLARLDRDSAMLKPVTALLRDRITGLDGPPRRALYLSMVCATTALPVVLLERVLGRADAEAAVAALRDQLIAARLDTARQVHTLVRDAAHEFLPPPDAAARLFAPRAKPGEDC